MSSLLREFACIAISSTVLAQIRFSSE